MTAQTPRRCFEDRLLDQLKLVVAENPAPTDDPADRSLRPRRAQLALLLAGRPARREAHGDVPGRPPRRASVTTAPATAAADRPAGGWRPSPRRLAFAAIPIALAAAVLALVLSLSGPRPGVAQAAVIARAAAALDQPNTTLYLQAQNYDGGTPCASADPSQCQSTDPATIAAGISADPANDTLTNTYQEWLSPDGSLQHQIDSNGDESVTNTNTNTNVFYEAADNTLTTFTDFTPPSLTYPEVGDLSIANIESMYQRAQAGAQNIQLIGQTTIGGNPVYELRIDIPVPTPANVTGNLCGSTVCTAPPVSVLLYVDSKTFLPVRTVTVVSNPNDLPGLAYPSKVVAVTEFAAQSLPDTPASESLLQMSSHPGATQTRRRAPPQ